ncbi:MAG: hypothetical protein IJU19_02390 [Bacteroidales bacterium]|nr:hypothetical protein [Bacteroidales bacterium]
MLKLMRKSTVVQLLVLVAAMVLLWGRAVVHPVPMEEVEGSGLLYGLLQSWLGALPRLSVVLAALLVLAEGMGFNLLLSRVGLVGKDSLLPALLFIVVSSAPAAALSPAVLVNGLLVLYVQQALLRGTLLTIPTGKVCSATALLGVASLVYLPAAAFLLSYLLVVTIYRLYSWRDWAALLLGLLAPYVLVVAVLYLTGDVATWWERTLGEFSQLGLHFSAADLWPAVGRVVLVALAVYSLIVASRRMNENPMAWQKNAQVVIACFVGAVALWVGTALFPPDARYLAVAFTLTGTQMLTVKPTYTAGRKRRQWLPEVLMLTLIIAALLC